MERVDVVVVGGGPAGSSAARAAAEGGAEVVLVEKGVPRADREGLGPDSTDAAGILDYWVDLMRLDVDALPDGVILRELDGAVFAGPTERVHLDGTGIPSSYPHFGFTFDRARFDDWLRSEAEAAGVDYRVGVAVATADTDLNREPRHVIDLRDGTAVGCRHLILADGPQRRVTLGVLDQFLPDDGPAADRLASTTANHIAYQEYRRFPEAAFEPSVIKFWWGHMPGETAYPWVFPNDGTVARVGLTMPIGLSLDDVRDRDAYPLLRPEDGRVPTGAVYLRRLLEAEYGDDYDVEADFPLVTDRGKREGTETYPISSTRPIDSPVRAGIAVAGGAMGATSAFHEGGDHVAVRTGTIAGELAAADRLERYNRAWKEAVGDEIRRNVVMADIVRGYGPADWDRAFRLANRLLDARGRSLPARLLAAGPAGVAALFDYKWRKRRYGRDGYVQLPASTYRV